MSSYECNNTGDPFHISASSLENFRKYKLFAQAKLFCEQEFNLIEIDDHNDVDSAEERQTKLTHDLTDLQLRLTKAEANKLFSSILQIVLSHHFQKQEITCLLEEPGQSCDFSAVRDTMYKYSKKAEEKFFS